MQKEMHWRVRGIKVRKQSEEVRADPCWHGAGKKLVQILESSKYL